MLILLAGLIGGMGLACMIYRSSFLGMLIGVQILVLGATMMFVLSGIGTGGEAVGDSARIEGHIAGLVITLGGVAQVVGGYALAIRMFYLKNKISMDELRSLKR